MTEAEEAPYRVDEQADAYLVVDGQGTTILQCRDAASAHHYTDLMNKAYRSGYRSGYRAGRDEA